MKYKRSERLVFITEYLTRRPNARVPLSTFVDKFTQAKSSISEDLRILKEVFENKNIGKIITTHDANGGVTFIPKIDYHTAVEKVRQTKPSISENLRILKEVFENENIGKIITTHGANGGVTFIPKIDYHTAVEIVREFEEEISQSNRLLPGGYLYLSDIVGNAS